MSVKALISTAALISGTLIAAPPAAAAPVAANAAACGNYAAKIAYLNVPSSTTGKIQLSYSSCTRNVWAYLESYAPPCQPAQDFCGDGTVHRNSDGAERTCSLPAGGTTCNSSQLYDGNVTSYAKGYIDNGAYTARNQTGSY